MKPRLLPFFAALLLALAGCDYEAPLTPAPTHKVDPRLVGDWIAEDPDAKQEEVMHVRAFDDSTYAVAMDNDIYRVYHSDFAGQPFVSVQELSSSGRSYCFYTWSLSAAGDRLSLRHLSTKVIPDKTKTSAELQKLIQANLANPGLLEKELTFTRKVKKLF